MRIAVGGIGVECCTFSPLPTRLDDFARWRGDALLARYAFRNAHQGVTFVPIVRAGAIPGGPVAPEAYATIKEEFLEGLRQGGPWDGVYLDMHGAMFVQGMQDAEGDWTTAVREVVGAECLIAASYDLHGNVSPRVMQNLDILTAYRTAPHIDGAETRARAIRLLVDSLRTQIRPLSAFVPIPTLFPGEKAMTTTEPAQSLYARLPETIARYGLLDASLLVGYAWADEPRVASAAVAVGQNAASVAQAARELASAWWAQRANFTFGMPTGSIDACIRKAHEAAQHGKPVFISDAGDNITGGGVGDVPLMLARMLEAGVRNAVYAAIADAEAVAACFNAGTRTEVTLALGGKLDTRHGTPLHVTGTVVNLVETDPNNRQAVVDVAGIKTVLTERRMAFTTVAQFDALALDLNQYDVVGIKLGYLFPELRPMAHRAFLALSPGAINPAVEQLPYRHLKRPIYPLDPAMRWQP
jgi:microcystin degradation protein MlrC